MPEYGCIHCRTHQPAYSIAPFTCEVCGQKWKRAVLVPGEGSYVPIGSPTKQLDEHGVID